MISGLAKWGFPPQKVVHSVMDVIKINKPPSHLLVGIDAKFVLVLMPFIPSWIMDFMEVSPINNNQAMIPAILKKKSKDDEKKTITTTTTNEKMKSH